MQKWHILFVVIYVIFRVGTVLCRNTSEPNNKPAKLGLFASHVQVRTVSSGHLCGGTLIDQEHVVTTAGCVVGHTPDTLTIMAGDITLRETEISSRQYLPVVSIAIHPFYNHKLDRRSFNIAVLRTQGKFKISKYLEPVHMQVHLERQKTRCFLTTWGPIISKDNVSQEIDVLHYAEFHMVDLFHCGHCPDSSMCAVNMGIEEGDCQSGEGGGLYCGGYLRGIDGGSYDDCSGGGKTFVDVLQLRLWIQDSVKLDGGGKLRAFPHKGKRNASESHYGSSLLMLSTVLMALVVRINLNGFCSFVD